MRSMRRSIRTANLRSLSGNRASASECQRVRRLGTSMLRSAKVGGERRLTRPAFEHVLPRGDIFTPACDVRCRRCLHHVGKCLDPPRREVPPPRQPRDAKYANRRLRHGPATPIQSPSSSHARPRIGLSPPVPPEPVQRQRAHVGDRSDHGPGADHRVRAARRPPGCLACEERGCPGDALSALRGDNPGRAGRPTGGCCKAVSGSS